MDVFIYSRLRLGRARQELEDDLDAFLAGDGEVTGGGAGDRGWNIDVELFVNADGVDTAVTKLREFLARWGVPQDTYLVAAGQNIQVFSSTP